MAAAVLRLRMVGVDEPICDPFPSRQGHVSHKAFASRLSRAGRFEVKTHQQTAKLAQNTPTLLYKSRTIQYSLKL
jgi:hypothetical protein